MRARSTSTTGRAQSARAPGLLSRVARQLAVAGLVAAIFMALLEIVSRIVDPFGVSYYPETARYLDTLIIEDPIGYRNRPGLNGRFWGTQVSINSRGLRDREIALQPAEDEFRILMLGDSVVFGLGVDDDDTIPRRLEQQLNRPDGTSVYRVINMGVPSYNTVQELEQLETVGFLYSPDMVLLVFSINDLQPKMWVLNRRDFWLTNIAQRSYAVSFLAVFYWELRAWLTGHDSRVPHRRKIEDHPGWPIVKSSLTRIARLCEERGIPFVLFLQESYPALETLAEDVDIPLAILEPLDAELRISLVNTHPNKAGTEQLSMLMRETLHNLGLN